MKKIFPIILVALVVLCGCEHTPVYYAMPDSEKPLFHVGDTFFYQSNDENTKDTLFVTSLYSWDSQEGEKKTSDIYEHIIAIFKNNSGVKFMIEEYSRSLVEIHVFDKDGIVYSLHAYSEDDSILIADGIKMSDDAFLYGKALVDNPTLWYSVNYGILQYSICDSLVFNLIESRPKIEL